MPKNNQNNPREFVGKITKHPTLEHYSVSCLYRLVDGREVSNFHASTRLRDGKWVVRRMVENRVGGSLVETWSGKRGWQSSSFPPTSVYGSEEKALSVLREHLELVSGAIQIRQERELGEWLAVGQFETPEALAEIDRLAATVEEEP